MPSHTRRHALQSIAATGSLLVAGCLDESTTPTAGDEQTPTSDAPTETPRAAMGSWPMFGADAGNSGYTRTGTGPGDTGTIAWRFDGGTPTLNASPVHVDGTVYTGASGDPGGIFAIDPKTGDERWSVDPEGYVTSAPAVVNETLYVGTWGQRFYAIDTADGAERWSTKLAHRFGEASPVVVDDMVYVVTYGYGPLVVSGPEDEEKFKAAAIIAFDAATGEEQWRYDEFDEKDRFSSSPAVDATHVYVGAEDGTMYALDRTDGTVVWTRAIAGHPDPDPAVVDGTVYYASLHDSDDTPGRLWALDAKSGETQWTYDVADGYVYVGAGTGITAITTVGEMAWQLDFQQVSDRDSIYIDSSPAIGDGNVFIGCSDGHLYGIEPEE